MNVGDTVPVCVEAFLFFGIVEMDVLTLALMIIASVAGSILMAGVVSKFDRMVLCQEKVQVKNDFFPSCQPN